MFLFKIVASGTAADMGAKNISAEFDYKWSDLDCGHAVFKRYGAIVPDK
jgi:hypothetical protein